MQFAFTITFHYIFVQLTMGLALLIFVLKTQSLRTGDPVRAGAARFWARIFGVNFALGVVTGIPMEFQFGTNWAAFAGSAGGVIGQTLAMEGVFSFFMESAFLGLFLHGERRLGPRGHWFTSLMMLAGSWLSGFFIVATNAWMQHPVGHEVSPEGEIVLTRFASLLGNEWALWQYLHTVTGAVVTAGFFMAATGAFYVLCGRFPATARVFLGTGVVSALIASVAMLFPTGDGQGKMIAAHQPATLAAMEGLFHTVEGAPMALIGQPDMERMSLDNPIVIPHALSFATYQRWTARVRGLDAFPREEWPEHVAMLYFAYHVMVGLGTILIAVAVVSAWLLFRGRLHASRPALWMIMLSAPFPFIANTAGWTTAELGRQPWLVYGLIRTADGASPAVSAGNALFTLIGFAGMYTVLSILYLFLMHREIGHGPEAVAGSPGAPGD
ncbi:MAG: cytochrome ubiquinol oxidase subunit I [Acidobacteria bacterium]|nr:cytochrome ubiquinol oxidase subunit I [Acidobacteriota bacterium]